MATAGGPHAPADGWQTRWIIQAGGLLLNSPASILIGISGIICCAMLDQVLSGLTRGLWGAILGISLTTAVASLVPVLICASLGVFEGYGIAQKSDLLSGARTLMAAVFLITSVALGIAATIILFRIALGTPAAAPVREGVDKFLDGGIGAVSGAIFATMLVNPLWVSIVSQMPMPFSQVRHTGFKIMRSSFRVWLAITLVSILVMQLTIILPAIAGMAALIFLCAWLYVASREIFGGISSNRYPMDAAASPMEA